MKLPSLPKRLPPLLSALSCLWVVAFLVVALSRLTFPLELEWMEGGSVLQALRFQRGLPLYPEPSAAGVQHLYTPLYSMVLGGLGFILPLGLALARIVSLVSVMATSVAIYQIVGYEGRPRSHLLAGVGIYLSSYVFAYRWYDVGRADSMCMALVLWSLLLLRRSWGDVRKAIWAGVLMGLAFWTKQTAFIFVVGSGAAALLVAPRQTWFYAATVGVIGFGGLVLGQWMSDGWMWTYIYELHQSHPFNRERFVRKSWLMMVHAWPFLVMCVGVVVADLLGPRLRRTRRLDARDDELLRTRLATRRGIGFWGINWCAAMVASALSYSTMWAEPNAFIPAAVLTGVFVASLLPSEGRIARVGGLLCSLQLVFAFLVEPRFQPIQDEGWAGLTRSYRWQRIEFLVPSEDERGRARELRDGLMSSSGPVLGYARPWWSVIASGGAMVGHAGSMGLKDVLIDDRKRIMAELAKEVRSGTFEQIWTEGEPELWLRRAMFGRYGVGLRLHGKERVRPMTGWMSPAGTLREYTADQIMFEKIGSTQPVEGEQIIVDFEGGSLSGMRTGGTAFGGRPVRSLYGKQPAIGPLEGEFCLSSAATALGVRARGTARTRMFVLPEYASELRLLLGTTGRTEGMFARLEGERGKTLEIPLPTTPWRLERITVSVPPEWRGDEASLVVSDDSPAAAVFFDDLRVGTVR